MDPTSGKLFGFIGKVTPSEETPAFPFTSAEPDLSRWYTLQWLKCQGFGEELAETDGSQCDTL